MIRLDGSVPTQYGLCLHSKSKCIDLKNELSKLIQLDTKLMLVCAQTKITRVHCPLLNSDLVKSSMPRHIMVYEIPNEETKVLFAVRRFWRKVQRFERLQFHNRSTDFWGIPFIITHAANVSNKDLYDNIFSQMKRLLKFEDNADDTYV